MKVSGRIKDAYFLFICFILFIFVFRSLILNLSTNLLDWNDYPYYVWTINQNVTHIKNFQFTGIFNTNIFYPHEGTLLFSDLLLPQSFISVLLSFFITDKVANFNLVFLSTLFLNTLAIFVFWKKLFKQRVQVYLGTFITSFSPFFFLSFNHFQMITFWPMFLGLSFLLDPKPVFRKSIIVGLLVSVQFLASVYLGLFMMFAIGVWYVLTFFFEDDKKEEIIRLVSHIVVVFSVFLIVAGPFLFKYLQVKNAYQINRDYGEYVLYAAHLSDYIFTTHYRSILSDTSFFGKWNSFDKHVIGEVAGFPGIALLGMAILGFLGYRHKKGEFSLIILTKKINIFFLILTVSGFMFSFGPRLSINGSYTGIPLPYHLIMKIVPFLEPVRATTRWMILFYIGLAFFALLGLSKINQSPKKQSIFACLVAFLFFLEIIPIKIETEFKDYYPSVYNLVANECSSTPKILLEYPMTQFKKDSNVVTNLSYRTQMMLASVRHGCTLVNGYSGYIPKDYERYESEMFDSIEDKKADIFWGLISEKQVSLIKLNKEELYFDRVERLESWIRANDRVKIILNDQKYLVAEILPPKP